MFAVGFNIKAQGNIEIHGVVEDSLIETEGAIFVKKGFVGNGRGVIRSRLNSITAGFVQNQND